MDKKILTFKEWKNENWNICKFEHVYEDQESCITCDGNPDKCPKERRAYKKYLSQFSDNAALIVMMQVN